MWCLMVVNIIFMVQSAQGGYEYPKPSIPFELPNRILQNSDGQILKTSNIDTAKTLNNFLPNEGYQHSHQYTNEEQIQSSVLKTLGISTVQPEQQNFEVGIKQHYSDVNPTQFNAYTSIDTTVPIQNAVLQSSLITDLNSVQQPVFSTNYPELILNIKNNVPPLVSLQNSKNELSDVLRVPQNEALVTNFNVHQVVNVPPLVNLNINQVETVNENIPELINTPHIELQQNQYIDAQIVQKSHKNENSAIRITPPIIQDFVPNVLNILNSVQPYSGDFNDQVVDTKENNGDLSNLNVEQIQNLQAALYEESGFLNNQLSSLSLQSLSAANIATPVITKSFSFHVPPPEIEEKSVVPDVLPPRKTYKIIFIKAPTYENRYNEQLLSRLAPVEEKTIVYVLSKKPEVTEQVVQPQPTKVSEHEVLYVQYKGDQSIDSEHISENISQLPINSSAAAYVEPRHLDEH